MNEAQCPFPGMRPFERHEAGLFFGQEAHMDALLSSLSRSRLTVVMGESGCGKSSLVKAGLTARLADGPSAALWHVVVCRPGKAPIHNLADQLAQALPSVPAGDVMAKLRSSSWGLLDLIESAGLEAGHRMLIVIDQFEELFRYYKEYSQDGKHCDAAELFVRLLLGVRERPRELMRVPVFVVLTMRSEYVGDAALFSGLAEAVNEGAFLLPKMSRTQVAAGILKPLAACGADIENRLLQELLNEAEKARQDGLPLLQNALRRIWDNAAKRPGGIRLSMDDFVQPVRSAARESIEDAGGGNSPACAEAPEDSLLIAHLLNQTLDSLYRSSPKDEATTERLFSLLGEYDHKGVLVRRTCSLKTAAAVCGVGTKELLRVISKFRDEKTGHTFLLPGEGRTEALLEGKEDLDIAHEALLRRWRRLRVWVREEARNADEFRWLAAKARRRTGALRGLELQRVLRWRKDFRPTQAWADRYEAVSAAATYPRETEFQRAMRHLDSSALKAWLRRGGVALVAGACVALAALTMRVDSLLRPVSDPISQLANARQAYGGFPWPLDRAKQALWSAYARLRPSYWFEANPRFAISAVAVNGERVAFASGNRVRFWEDYMDHLSPATCERPSCFEFPEAIRSLAFTDGKDHEVIAAGGVNHVYLLNLEQGRIEPLPGFSGGVSSVALNSDGSWLAASGMDSGAGASEVRLYNTKTLTAPASLDDDKEAHDVAAVAFQEDDAKKGGQKRLWVLAARRDGAVVQWEIEGGGVKRPRSSQLSIGPLTSIACTSNKVAVSGSGRAIAIVDGSTMQPAYTISPESLFISPVHRVAFNSDGSLLAAATADTVRVISVAGRTSTLPALRDFHGLVTAMDFDDADNLVIGTADGVVEVFRPAVGEFEARAVFTVPDQEALKPEDVNTIEINADADRLAAGIRQDLVLWSMNADGRAEQVGPAMHFEVGPKLPIIPDGIYRVLFLQDGRIAVGLSDGAIQLVELDKGKLGSKSAKGGREGGQVVWALAENARKHVLAAGYHDGYIELYSTAERGKLTPIGDGWLHNGFADKMSYGTAVRDLQFAPDGRLASAGADGRIKVWRDGVEDCALEGHGHGVRSIAFGPSGKLLVSGSEDGTVREWDLSGCSGKSVIRNSIPLNRYSDYVQSVGFAGETWWALSKDGRVTVYNADGEGKPLQKESYDLFVPTAFKLSAGQNRVAISTASNNVYIYPASPKRVAAVADRRFPPEREERHRTFLEKKPVEDAAAIDAAVRARDLLKQVRAELNCADQPGRAQKLLRMLTTLQQQKDPTLEIDANVWGDLCFFGSLSKEAPGGVLLPACYAGVATNPGDWNVRANLAFALARSHDPGALAVYRAASLAPGFRVREKMASAFQRLDSGRSFESADFPALIAEFQENRDCRALAGGKN